MTKQCQCVKCSCGTFSTQQGFIFKKTYEELRQQTPQFPVSHHLGDRLRNVPLFGKQSEAGQS